MEECKMSPSNSPDAEMETAHETMSAPDVLELLPDYPTIIQAETAFAVYWSLTTGAKPTAADLVKAEWILQGYTCSIGVPKVFGNFSDATDPLADLKHAVSWHLKVAAPHVLGDGKILAGLGGFLQGLPWGTILPIISQLGQIALKGAA
jgi:hypothetical protein